MTTTQFRMRGTMNDNEPKSPHGSMGASTLKGLAALGSSTLITSIFRIVVVAVMARLLSPTDFGIVAVANIFIEFSRLITTTGIAQAIVQKNDLSQGQIETAFTASVFAGVVTMLMMIAFSPFIARFFGLLELPLVLYVCSTIAPLSAVSTVSSKLLERAHNFGPLAKSATVSYVGAQVAVGIPIAYFGGGLWALVVPQVLAALWQSLILVRAQPHKLSLRFGRREYRELMELGTGFGLQRFANFIAQRGDYFVVGKLLGPLELGRYERSYVLMNLSNSLLASSLSTALFPAFSRLADDRRRFARAYMRAMGFGAFITIPISMLCVVFAEEIVETLLGRRWLDAVMPFAILSAGIFARTCYKIAGTAGNGLGLAYRNVVSQCIYAVCVVGGAAVGANWGVNGVAVSTLLAILVVFTSLNHTVLRAVGLSWRHLVPFVAPGFFTGLALAGIAYPVALFLRAETSFPAFIRLACGGTAAGLPYVICIILYPRVFLGQDLLDFVDEKLPGNGITKRLRKS